MNQASALSIVEAAQAAGVSRATLFALLSRGEGPPTLKIGARRLIRRESLERWLADLEAQQARAAEAGR